MLYFLIDTLFLYLTNAFVAVHQVISQVAVFRNFFVVTKYKRAQKFETELGMQQQIQTGLHSIVCNAVQERSRCTLLR